MLTKTAVVTGASSGIGRAIAIKMATEDINVILVARRKQKLLQLEDEINSKHTGRALAISADIASHKEVQSMVKQGESHFGNIDIYVNNAGQMLNGVVSEGNVHDWENMIDVNIKGVLYGIHEVIPSMIKRKQGHIVNISSVSGFEVTKRSTVYSATKFAVRAISMGLEKELARTGVRVTNISPGMVDTDLVTRKIDRQPLNTEDIANAVFFAVTQPEYVNVNEITVRPI